MNALISSIWQDGERWLPQRESGQIGNNIGQEKGGTWPVATRSPFASEFQELTMASYMKPRFGEKGYTAGTKYLTEA